MPEGYIPIFIFMAVALAFPIVALGLAKLLRPAAPSVTKLEAYECGIQASGGARGRYTVRFYIIAILFVIFDVKPCSCFRGPYDTASWDGSEWPRLRYSSGS